MKEKELCTSFHNIEWLFDFLLRKKWFIKTTFICRIFIKIWKSSAFLYREQKKVKKFVIPKMSANAGVSTFLCVKILHEKVSWRFMRYTEFWAYFLLCNLYFRFLFSGNWPRQSMQRRFGVHCSLSQMGAIWVQICLHISKVKWTLSFFKAKIRNKISTICKYGMTFSSYNACQKK